MKNPTIYTYSILYSTTDAFLDRLPYVSAIIELENGSKFASLLEGYVQGMKIKIGQEVKYLGEDKYGKARYSLE
ncbi:OB-fold domain-containing protein [Clostridium sp. JNZ J1-5]